MREREPGDRNWLWALNADRERIAKGVGRRKHVHTKLKAVPYLWKRSEAAEMTHCRKIESEDVEIEPGETSLAGLASDRCREC